MTEAVKTEGIVKIYSGKETVDALKGVNISIGKGELFTLLGPNGAGKTTFLRIIATQLMPTKGDAFVLGYNVLVEPKEVRKHIAVVPQDVAAYSSYTPWDYAYNFAKLRGMAGSEAKKAADRALKAVDIQQLKKRTCATLSGGERRRALIAACLASEADVLMLDEPTSGLDAVARRGVWSALRDMVKEGKTIILTTHMMEEAEMVSDRLVIINKGVVISEGSPREIKGLAKEKYRVIVEGKFDRLDSYGEVAKLGDRNIVYVKDQDDALELLKLTLKKGLRAEASPVTLEDVFVKLVGGVNNEQVH
ncbi:MAG TPA: ABC transporter ATP-binding protein [Candidatus Bathyarchaeia archaeon]|nr:ABC transporter ATP-binding protein [Candidatus Bathyarchaeia archaeon]